MTALLLESLFTCPIRAVLRLKESARQPSPASAISFLISTHLPCLIHTQA
ncbi:MAG: hypothetical protein U5O69_07425 [Candidatus Competibacteraceae bacterium]|nr:hypothetical protein [Candidatus Competibacteraceae bacterium]